MRPDAVLLASFGGPEAPEEVMPFLERVTAGRQVPRERLEHVAEHYYALGGVSPINGHNRALLASLRAELDRRGIDLPLIWGNRNAAPTFDDALREAYAGGSRSVLAIATSAYASYSSCRQYREDLAAALARTDLAGELEVRKARPFADRAGFVDTFTTGVVEALSDTLLDGVPEHAIRVLFTTHSLPLAMADTAGPADRHGERPGQYERQHEQTAAAIMAAAERAGLPAVGWQLVFQSRSGPPQMPWLEPDIDDALRKAAADGIAAVIVAPIGFVSDHMEVVWDLDREARELANGLGLSFRRVPTPGTDPRFVAMLVDLVEESLRADDDTDSPPAADAGRLDVLCAADCCPGRTPRATVAAG